MFIRESIIINKSDANYIPVCHTMRAQATGPCSLIMFERLIRREYSFAFECSFRQKMKRTKKNVEPSLGARNVITRTPITDNVSAS